jgi:hypothetical protein
MSQLQKKLESYPVFQGYYAFKVDKGQEHYGIRFPDGVGFGMINAQTARALDAIVNEPSVYFEAFALARQCQGVLRRAQKPGEATLAVDLNVCGSRDAKQIVGDRLSAAKVYLQRIEHQTEKYHYDNPHVISFPGMVHDVTLESNNEALGSVALSATQKLHETFAEVCDSLQRDSTLKRVEKDIRIKTPLLE